MIFYLIESSLLLGIFYAIYAFILSRETFFQFNRIVLLAIPLLSLAIPLIILEFNTLPATVLDQPIQSISKLSTSYHDAMASWEFEVGSNTAASSHAINSLPWSRLLLISVILIYFVGVVICLSRTVWSIRWIVKVLSNHPYVENKGVKIVKLSHPTAPFSFLNYLFVHAPFSDSEDFRQVLDHERTHIQEKHTFDLFYFQLIAALFWFNPAIWLLLKSLKTIHEYIADRKIIRSGYSVTEYQTLLLRQLISNNSYEFVHNFNLSFIKKRITMMTNKKSGWAGRTRVGVAIAAMLCCSAIIIQCNSKNDDLVSPSKITAEGVLLDIKVPILPPSDFKFDADLSNTLTLTISNNALQIADKEADISEISNIQDAQYGRELPIIMMVDKEQQMGFVRQVHMALRVADRRKLLYIGQTSSGKRVELPIMLPPDPNSTYLQTDLSKVPDENLLKIDLGKNEGKANQKKVYDFVTSFIAKGQGELPVVSAWAGDGVTYEAYLLNFFFIKEGYIQIYQERSRELFKKDFYQTTKDEYQKVRENIPTNISIAEDK